MHILIADDEEDDRFHLKRILIKSGHTVIEAADRESALKTYRERFSEIDFIITDLRMPSNEDGFELISAIRALDPRARVWLATSHLHEDTESKAISCGAEKAVQKIDLRHELSKAGIVHG